MRFTIRLCQLAAVLTLAAPFVRAQQAGASVRVNGQVSPVAAVSAGPAARVTQGAAVVSASRAGLQTLLLSVSGAGGGETRIELPFELRSNAAFTLKASCAASGATLSAVSVVEVEGSGQFVHPGAAGRVEIPVGFDGRGGARLGATDAARLSSPSILLSGPPVSMRGTLDSPANRLGVVLRVVFTATTDEKNWRAELRLSAEPRGQE